MATMNSQKHMPAAPMSNSLRRPSLSMSCTPTMVIAVLTTSAMILEIWRSVRGGEASINENSRYDERIRDPRCLEECRAIVNCHEASAKEH